jgi:hypothetical protein
MAARATENKKMMQYVSTFLTIFDGRGGARILYRAH